ncbi:tRNA (adenosine(37)-N6)-threonylcarbamoyltransferase complex transferase subunit TsaD, partial [Candidatus Calescamantes bacterium]|nr:tRNA (adenosine(37)-N6)-threonylcarbamoyltransferase complex transferase subunit TsaD [Candidatus Calescamantes bacterium]
MPLLNKDIILGIDTSCDDTSCGIVKKGKMVLSSVVSSQDSIHAPFGGIVPEIASRAHVEKIAWVVKEAMERANITFENIGGIGVTQGPGLPGSLLVGWEFAKALSFALDIPFIGINHLEAHLFSPFLDRKEEIYFPVLGLVVSGG